MLSFRELLSTFNNLAIEPGRPVIVHASLSAFGQVRGGAETVVGALLAAFQGVMMPTFTYKTMIIPETGPPDNGIQYGMGENRNQMAEFFHPDMPADKLMGVVAETLRRHPRAKRSGHPILSFAGVGVDHILAAQTLDDPLVPIQELTRAGGWVLLLGVTHTVNTSIHYAEKLAGRKQFVRWALTPTGVRECPGFPGCSDGFDALKPYTEEITRKRQIGAARLQAIPLSPMIAIARKLVEENPAALLCHRLQCPRCNAIRAGVNTARAPGLPDG